MGNDEARTNADERITQLYGAVPEIQSASSETAIYEAIVETAVSTLGFNACAVSVPDNGLFDERVCLSQRLSMSEPGSTNANSQGRTEATDNDSSVTVEVEDIADSGFYIADKYNGWIPVFTSLFVGE